MLVTHNEPQSTQIQNAEEEDVKTAIGAAAVIDGMMGVILRLTRTHQGALTAEEEARLQQAQQAAVGAAPEMQNSGKSTTNKRTTGPRHGQQTVETQLEGSLKRKSMHPTWTRR